MVYMRGHANDYDNWAKLGCKGWEYENCLPHFIKVENNDTFKDPKFHGTSGELNVTSTPVQ